MTLVADRFPTNSTHLPPSDHLSLSTRRRASMNVVLYSPAGMIGSRTLTELVSRGHNVTAVARDPSKVPAHPGVTAVKGDIFDTADVAAKVIGAEAVISAYGPGTGDVNDLLKAT